MRRTVEQSSKVSAPGSRKKRPSQQLQGRQQQGQLLQAKTEGREVVVPVLAKARQEEDRAGDDRAWTATARQQA